MTTRAAPAPFAGGVGFPDPGAGPESATLLHHLLDAAVRGHAGRPALSEGQRTLTYAELDRAVRAAARRLAALGVRRGDRVVISATARIPIVAAVFATSRVGAVFTVVHEQVRGEPLAHVLRDSEPVLLVTDDPRAADDALARGVATTDATALAEPPADGDARRADPAPDVRGHREPGVSVDPACLIYTSGTTTLPKAVVSTHQQMLFAASAIAVCLGYRATDVVYSPSPLSFDFGLYQVLLTVSCGAHLVLGDAREAGPPLLGVLERRAATVLPAVPSVVDRLAWLLRHSSRPPSTLRLITTTGAALSEQTIAAVREAAPAAVIQVMYGLTECKRTAIMPPDGDRARPGSCGLPLPGTEVRVVDDDGDVLPPGRTGQFVVRGPHVMAGYWRRPELTAQRFVRREGLFPELMTGDYGWMDQDGYLYFAGRRDDLYKERGFRVSTTEVEAAALRVAGVHAAAVLPPEGPCSSTLAVVTGAAPEQVLDRLRELIEPYKVPRRCVVVTGLPTNGNGKTDRRALAALVREPAGTPMEKE